MMKIVVLELKWQVTVMIDYDDMTGSGSNYVSM